MGTQKPKKLLDQVRELARIRHYSKSTEKTYVYWIKRYIYFHGKRHPKEMGAQEIEQFLSFLAQHQHLSASSQNQAFSAVLFLHRDVLKMELPGKINALRAIRRERIPIVLTTSEARRVIAQMKGVPRLIVQILYGSGLRINECLNLRVNHIDLEADRIRIVDGKGKKDRVTVLPKSVKLDLVNHLQSVKQIHERDVSQGWGKAVLPHALHRKYKAASGDFLWQFAFPQHRLFTNKETGERGRWHFDQGVLQRAVKCAAKQAGIMKRVTPHVFRHSFATHLLEQNCNIRTVQTLLGHRSLKTTMAYTHLMENSELDVVSPLDTP